MKQQRRVMTGQGSTLSGLHTETLSWVTLQLTVSQSINPFWSRTSVWLLTRF